MFPGFPQSPIKIPVWLSIFSAPHRQRLSEPPRRSGTAGYPQCQHPLQGVGLCMGPRMGLRGCSHISVFPKELGARGSTAPSDKPTWVLLKEQGAEHGPILQTTWVLAFLAHGVLHSTHGCSPASPHVAFAQEHLHSSTSQETDREGCSALGLGTRPPCTPMGAGPPEAPRSPQLSPFRGAAGRAKATQQRCTHLGLRAIYL